MDQSNPRYTGINRLLKSAALQTLMDRRRDGSFREFLEDWKWIFSFSKKYRWMILAYTVLGVLGTTLGLVSSVASKYLIDIIMDRNVSSLWYLAAAMVLSMVLSLVLSSLVSRFSAKLGIYVKNDIQSYVFDRVLDADWLSLSGYSNGDLLNRFQADIGTVSENAVSWIPNVVIAVYRFAATFAVILHYDVMMALIALLSAPFLLFFGRYLLKKNKEYRKRVLELNSEMTAFEVETFYNFDTIKSFGTGEHYSRGLRKRQKLFREYSLDYNRFTIRTNVWMTLLNTGVGFVAFGYCLLRLWTNSITYGTMTLFLGQRSQLTGQFQSLMNILPGMLNGSVSAHRIREVLSLPREVHMEDESAEMASKAADGFEVRLTGVGFAYVQEDRVICNSDFSAKPGEIVALIGPSGEGKTTLIRLILGLVHPEEGSVNLVCTDGTAVPLNADTRRYFAYVPQGNTLLSGTVAENLRMAREDATDEELEAALRTACAWDFVSRLDGGIHCRLGERGKGLSEGQAQRIAIARAVLRDAPVLLLDEATSALDVETERQVLRNIVRSHPNKTCIVTTHRPSVLNLSNRVYRVMDTRVTELDEATSSAMAQDF